MSRFKNEVVRLESHIKTLRAGCGVLFGIAVLAGLGWWDALFVRGYAKSEPGNLCSKQRFQSQAHTYLPW